MHPVTARLMSRIKKLRRPRRRERSQTKHGACSCAKDLYTKEMEKMSTTNSPYLKAGQQSVAIYGSSQPLTIGAIQGGLTVASSSTSNGTVQISNGPFGRTPSVVDAVSSIRSELLENEAFGLTVERMVDLWITKHGNDWIDIVEIQDDQFWTVVYMRLKALGELEVHYLTDRARYVCRKPI